MTCMGRVATRFVVGPAAARSCLEIRPTASSQEATSVLRHDRGLRHKIPGVVPAL